MARKAKSETSKITMADLAILFCQCEVIYAEALFGWKSDREIALIGKNAKKAVEYTIGEELTANRDRRKAIEEEHRKPYANMEYDEANDVIYRDALRRDKEYTGLIEKEQKLWETTMEDFEFQAVKVKITNEITKKIKKPERVVTFREKQYSVETYTALAYLVDNGYLVETT